MSAIGRLIISADHLDRSSVLEIVECEIDCGAAVVTRTLGGIGNKNLFVLRRSIPENLRHIPRTITVVDQQTIAQRFQLAIDADERFGRCSLQKGTWLRIKLG